MGELVRKFARRVIVLHLLGFLAVLALVLGAASQLHRDARRQILERVTSRQELVAQQTSTGLAEFFDTLLDSLDLLRRTEGAEEAAPRERVFGPLGGPELRSRLEGARNRRQELQPASRPVGPPRSALPGGVAGSSLISTAEPPATPPGLPQGLSQGLPQGLPQGRQLQPRIDTATLLWRQLESRVSHLFAFDPATGQAVQIGRHEGSPPTSDVCRAAEPFLRSLTRAGISPLITVADAQYVLVAAPVIAPDRSRRLLVVAVPLETIRAKFLLPLDDGSGLSYSLFDHAGTVVCSTSSGLVAFGPGVAATTRPEAAAQPPSSIAPATVVLTESRNDLPPSVVVVSPVDVEGPNWTLVLASPLANVDVFLSQIVRKAMFWSGFLMLATAGLLISTSVRLIRDRVRFEHQRQAALQREMDQARAIQLDWLPSTFPARPGLAIAALNVPASHVSGDFYNCFELPDGRLALLVGDVTGHGLSAAMQMSSVQLLAQGALRTQPDPGKALALVNATLCLHDFSGQFVTLLLLVLDPRTGEVAFASAGHPAPVLLRDGKVSELPQESELMLGVQPDVVYPTNHARLHAPATLLLYTDGLPETFGPRGQLLGLPNVLACLRQLPPRTTPEALINQVKQLADSHRGTTPLHDDLTLLAATLDFPGA
jgi:serine phosphatase RsbU (regulator of sigma subunit)